MNWKYNQPYTISGKQEQWGPNSLPPITGREVHSNYSWGPSCIPPLPRAKVVNSPQPGTNGNIKPISSASYNFQFSTSGDQFLDVAESDEEMSDPSLLALIRQKARSKGVADCSELVNEIQQSVQDFEKTDMIAVDIVSKNLKIVKDPANHISKQVKIKIPAEHLTVTLPAKSACVVAVEYDVTVPTGVTTASNRRVVSRPEHTDVDTENSAGKKKQFRKC